LFVSGISHPLFKSVAYETEEDLEKIVGKFIKDQSAKVRQLDIKLALDTPDYEKLEQLAQSKGKSQAGVIKDLLLENLKNK
jgi:hypothetical protein